MGRGRRYKEQRRLPLVRVGIHRLFAQTRLEHVRVLRAEVVPASAGHGAPACGPAGFLRSCGGRAAGPDAAAVRGGRLQQRVRLEQHVGRSAPALILEYSQVEN